MSRQCATCAVVLDSRNKSGYCTSHKGDWKKLCNTCDSMMYAGTKSGLCSPCYNKKYYQDNRDRLNSYYNNVYHNNKKDINKRRAKREKYRWHNDQEFRLKKSIRSRFKKAVKEEWRSGSFINSLGCSVEELKKHLENQFQKEMSWENYGEKWEIDHIVPFCKIDLSDWEQVKSVIHYSNLQPLLKIDHISKTTEDRKHVSKK